MSKNKVTPAFQIYPGDLLSQGGLSMWPPEVVGCYFLLLLHLWAKGGSLPNRLEKLQQVMQLKSHKKTRSVLKRLKKELEINSNTIRSPLIDQQIQKQAAQRVKSSAGGRAKAAKCGCQEVIPNVPKGCISFTYSEINDFINILGCFWNEFSPKKITAEQLDAAFDLLMEPEGPLHSHDFYTLFQAIKNYRQALKIPNTKAWEWNFFNFLQKGYVKYMSGRFDIDNYDPKKFKTTRKGAISDGGSEKFVRSATFVDPEARRTPLEI